MLIIFFCAFFFFLLDSIYRLKNNIFNWVKFKNSKIFNFKHFLTYNITKQYKTKSEKNKIFF